MAKVMLAMQYEIDEEKRSDYLETVEFLKVHFASNQHITYTVFEQKGKRNYFSEIFIAPNEASFKLFEESDDETADSLASKLSECIKGGRSKYTTYIEAR